MTEAMPNGATPQALSGTVKSQPSANGLRTVLKFQRVLAQRYFDAAGFPGRTVGLDAESGKQKTAGEKGPPAVIRRAAGRINHPPSDTIRRRAPGNPPPP